MQADVVGQRVTKVRSPGNASTSRMGLVGNVFAKEFGFRVLP